MTLSIIIIICKQRYKFYSSTCFSHALHFLSFLGSSFGVRSKWSNKNTVVATLDNITDKLVSEVYNNILYYRS